MTAPCGFTARCGRPAGHSGHHGGWRTMLELPAEQPLPPGYRRMLTMHELRIVAEYLLHGDQREAAACLGMRYSRVKDALSVVNAKVGAKSSHQVPFLLGWVRLPYGTYHVTEPATCPHGKPEPRDCGTCNSLGGA